MEKYLENLRDDIAIAAMKAEVASRSPLGSLNTGVAEKAYKMADAMLRARESGKTK